MRTRSRNPLTWLLVVLVRGYQTIVSPWFPQTCRYYPSCSAYAITALRRHGPLKGTALAVGRVLRCHPWSAGGVDHVPPRGRWSNRGGTPEPGVPGGSGPDAGARTLGADTRGARSHAPQDY
ncbi:membrane protein insertion efficiency factor YidD [Georgenia deserti]|uniref:Putative membrane protein insertion efficiency factor n=1 Tax=Georgenia deserti TaxID=2093781 RepID=A0ABW4L6R1_9MICO